MDGEVAQIAALVISANHRISRPDDPMLWFDQQRAFERCGSITFHAKRQRRLRRDQRVRVAETPREWLDRLAGSGVQRVVLSFERQDHAAIPDETLPDRIAAGFAGGGSLWTMTTETPDGGALAWQGRWRAAYPDAQDGRIWAVEYQAAPAGPAEPGTDLALATEALESVLQDFRAFASDHHFENVAAIFASALCLLKGEIDPRPVARPVGPADTLAAPVRDVLYAAQRGWVFDNIDLWRDQDFSPDLWERYAALSERLYTAVTTALAAAVNRSKPAESL